MERLAASGKVTEEEKVGEVSRQFEALLLRQILGEAQKTVFHSKINSESTAGSIYQDMITNQLADNISKSGAFGLARILQHQLAHELKVAGSKHGEEP